MTSPAPRSPLLVPLLAGVIVAVSCSVHASAGDDDSRPTESGWIGIYAEPSQQMTDDHRASLGHGALESGTVVTVVSAGSPAETAGVKAGDLLLSLAGEAVPVFSKTGKFEADEVARRAWHAALRKRLEALPAHRPTALVLRRGGKEVAVTLEGVTFAEARRIQGGTDVPLPSLASSGSPKEFAFDFDGVAEGTLPADFFPHQGHWTVGSPSGSGGRVLVQDRPTLPWAVAIVAGPGRAVADGRIRVRIMPRTGIADQSGGIVFRAQDANNYYLVRPNAIEDNFRIYVLKDNARTTIADLRVEPPAANAWHDLEVEFIGDVIRATLDGKNAIEAKDGTYASGWCGLWTKADSVTLFDDFRVTPAGAR